MDSRKSVIICVPGLGGHESSLRDYKGLLPEYDLRYLRLIDHTQALHDIIAIARREERVTVIANCYGAQPAIRAMAAVPGCIERLVIVEPFFAERRAWRLLGLAAVLAIVSILRLLHALGISRKRFPTHVDYTTFAKYPIFMQPLYDIRWQSLMDYFLKLEDIATFKLPERIETPTLFVVSPKGYMRSSRDRAWLKSIFVHGSFAEVNHQTHNIISRAAADIAPAIRTWLARN